MHKKRLILASSVLGTLGLLAFLPRAGLAGEYHYGQYLLCYDCHTTHFGQSHNWDGSTPVSTTGQPNGNWLGSTGPNQYLLKANGVNNLCLACHDGQGFAPDVLGANANTYVRQAGALNRAGLNAPYETWKGHTLDLRTRPPGGTSSVTMDCQQCHEVHGSQYYRNLSATSPMTYTKDQPYATRTKTVDVWVKQWVQGDLAGNYSYDSVRFNEPNSNASAYADFCAGCHGRFHGNVGGSNIGGNLTTGGFIRHPTVEVNIGAISDGQHSSVAQYSGGQSRVHVMSGATADYLDPGASFSVADGLTPSCLSCHKAHGNQNPFGLIFLARTPGPVTEEGTPGVTAAEGMRNLCGQCHVQGSSS